MTWIACSERMPASYTELLLWRPDRKRVGIGRFYPKDTDMRACWEDRADADQDGCPMTLNEREVSHWMPLPEAP